MTRRVAEFTESEHALRFAKMLGPDYCVCGGINFAWAVRPKMAHEFEHTRDSPPELRTVEEWNEGDL